MKVRRITRMPRAQFDRLPRARRRKDFATLRRFVQRMEKFKPGEITMTRMLRMLTAVKWQKRKQRLMDDHKKWRLWFERRYLQVKLGVRKDIQKVPHW